MKRSEQVALEIVESIVDQNLAIGDKLPLESEMLVQHRVSRSSLREAMRLLEVQGLVTIRPGPGGGTEVGRIDPANLSRTLDLYLLMGRSSFRELLDAWLMVEPMLAGLAAANPDRDRVRALMHPFSTAASERDRELGAGLAFHDIVAELAGNQMLTLLLGAVGFLVTEQVRARAAMAQMSDASVDAHWEIADHILAGDQEQARSAMHAHLLQVIIEIGRTMPLEGAFRI